MNTTLINDLLYLFSNGFRVYLIFQLLKAFFDLEGSKRCIIIRYSLFVLFFVINSVSFLCLHWNSGIVLLSNIVGVFIITLTYHGKWKYRVAASFVVVGLNLICEDLVYRLAIQLHMDHIIIISITASDLMLLVIVLILQKLSHIRNGQDVLMSDWIGVIFTPLTSMVISAFALDKCDDETAIIIGGIGLLILNIFVVYHFDHLAAVYKERAQFLQLDEQNQAYKKQLDILTQSEEKISSFRHDMKNHIIALKHISKQGDLVGLEKYLDGMFSLVQTETRIVSTGDYLLDGLINAKLGEVARTKDFEADCEVKVQNIDSFNKTDISIILGNLLDNAVYALEKCDEKRKFKLLIEEKKGLLIIKVENNHEEEIREKNGVFLTTKKEKNGHGIGLKNVKRIVKKYDGEINITYTDRWFCVEVLLFV